MAAYFQASPAQTVQDLMSRPESHQNQQPPGGKGALFASYKNQLIKMLDESGRLPNRVYSGNEIIRPNGLANPEKLIPHILSSEYGFDARCTAFVSSNAVQHIISLTLIASFLPEQSSHRLQLVNSLRMQMRRLDEETTNFARGSGLEPFCRGSMTTRSVERLVNDILNDTKDASQIAVREINQAKQEQAEREQRKTMAAQASRDKAAQEKAQREAQKNQAKARIAVRCVSEFGASPDMADKAFHFVSAPWFVCELLTTVADKGGKAAISPRGKGYRIDLQRGGNRIHFDVQRLPDLQYQSLLIPVAYNINGVAVDIQDRQDIFNLELNIEALLK